VGKGRSAGGSLGRKWKLSSWRGKKIRMAGGSDRNALSVEVKQPSITEQEGNIEGRPEIFIFIFFLVRTNFSRFCGPMRTVPLN